MFKTLIADGIIRYQFPPHEGKHFGFNLFALLDETTRQVLLVDTGYEEHAAAVFQDLTEQGYALNTVVISHFHPDHILGLQALPRVKIVGSPRYEETLRTYGPRGEWEPFAPTETPGEDGRIAFGRFLLRFELAPGHAPCSQYTLINEELIHVADNVMTSNHGLDILPWAEFAHVPDHIASLERLRGHAHRTFLLSHGVEISDPAVVEEAIENRIRYFQAILDGNARISFEQATAGCSCSFLHSEWLIRNAE